MKQYVFSFQDAEDLAAGQVGAKAAGILRLRANGFNVPDGFCVISDAYTEHLRMAKADVADKDPHAIRKAIIQMPLSSLLVAQIESHYCQLSSPVAVRSSATAEDLPEHSFAGQYDTFLSITDLEECLSAVKKCWASVWTERAVQYRLKKGIDSAAVDMAVLVQTQVNADSAGVVFTADPVTGNDNRITIESCWGLGDKLVGGTVTPDRFSFDKTGPTLLRFEPAKADLPPSIAETDARRLAERALQIERTFGCPQDIEWAIAGRRVFFLQSRPITTRPKLKTFQDRQVWTNMNTAEVLPDVVTPLTWSIIGRLFNPLFRSAWRMLGVDLDGCTIAGLVAGRAYFNVNTGMASVGHLPLFVHQRLVADELLGGNAAELIKSGRLTFENADLPDVRGRLWKMFLRMPETLYKLYLHRPSRSRYFLEQLRVSDERLKAINPAELTEHQLCALIHTTVEQELKKWDLLFIGSAVIYYPFFRRFCHKKLGDENGAIAHRLIRGQEGMEDVQAGFDLWKLAAAAYASDLVRHSVMSTLTFEDLLGRIGASQEGNAFLSEWDACMDTHGHHCRGELELYNARWSEQPDYILQLVKNYMSGMDTLDPSESRRQLELQRQELVRQCLQKLSWFNRLLFSYLLEKIRFGLKLRENWKSRAVRLLVHLRMMFLEMGRKLRDAHIVENADDIFFMTLEEIRPAAEYASVAELRQTIQSRRHEYEQNEKLSPPHIVVGNYQGQAETQDDASADSGVLHGLAVCPGKVRGKARIILRADETSQVLPGEILVAPYTDPAWTPYFLTAAGIVMDQGGMLSHGSIVAREYGIPAVVNVGPATKIIPNGALVEVDADRGIVRILS